MAGAARAGTARREKTLPSCWREPWTIEGPVAAILADFTPERDAIRGRATDDGVMYYRTVRIGGFSQRHQLFLYRDAAKTDLVAVVDSPFIGLLCMQDGGGSFWGSLRFTTGMFTSNDPANRFVSTTPHAGDCWWDDAGEIARTGDVNNSIQSIQWTASSPGTMLKWSDNGVLYWNLTATRFEIFRDAAMTSLVGWKDNPVIGVAFNTSTPNRPCGISIGHQFIGTLANLTPGSGTLLPAPVAIP